MRYLITFLEGIMSFISPCMLPMLPVYLSYFAAGQDKKRHAFVNACFFVLGFTLVFCLLGVFAGSIGTLFARHKRGVELVCGLLVVLFGLSYLNIIPLRFLKGMQGEHRISGAFSALLFGMIYSVSLTPCVGAFLGSALMLASSSATALTGCLLLLVYSLGLGIPFILSAVLLEQLGAAFSFIKRHYRAINLICGVFLILTGFLMAVGLLDRFLLRLS